MAIENIPYVDRDTFARPNKNFYPLKIPVSHWQLRHYISHPEKDVLYYASRSDIYYLNTVTRHRIHIANLPFEARCTASGFGYVCVGGEVSGDFAVIKLESRTLDSSPSNSDYRDYNQYTPYAADVKVNKIGDEIVNSISIHRIHDEEAHLYDVVAVLTNNDKTVRIYSLLQGVEDAVLHFPFPMNHATISPDGKMLAAVGDINTAYFYTRDLREDPPQIPKPHNRLTMLSVDWSFHEKVKLYLPDPTAQAGYFTTAWSPSGQYLAFGSEAGYISVFDMRLFVQLASEDIQDAMIACIASSRPNISAHMHPGAVRTMLFSPEPWDLLIWAEDQGRICIADMRSALREKQVIELDLEADTVTKLEVQDLREDHDVAATSRRALDLGDDFLQRYHENFGTDTMDSRLRQRIRQHYRMGSHHDRFVDDPQGLSAHEQRVLETIRTTRQREEAISHGTQARSINYVSQGLVSNHRHERAGMSASDSNRSTVDLSSTLHYNDGFPELSRTPHRSPPPPITTSERDTSVNLRPLTAIQQLLHDQGTPRHDTRQDSPSPAGVARWQPRRRASVVLSPSGGASVSRLIPPQTASAESNTATTFPNGYAEDDEPWRIVSNAMNLTRGPLFESNSTSLESETNRDRLQQLHRQRDRLREIQRRVYGGSTAPSDESSWNTASIANRYELLRDALPTNRNQDYDMLRRRVVGDFGSDLLNRSTSSREIAVRTAGLALSRDGGTVWAATEEGIFEIKIDLKARFRWPAMDLK